MTAHIERRTADWDGQRSPEFDLHPHEQIIGDIDVWNDESGNPWIVFFVLVRH